MVAIECFDILKFSFDRLDISTRKDLLGNLIKDKHPH